MNDDEVDIEDIQVCDICDTEIGEGDEHYTEWNTKVCNNCVMVCENCDSVQTINDDFSIVDGDYRWCEGCRSEQAYWCDRCEEYNSNGCSYINDIGVDWCEDCSGNWAVWCDSCGEYNTEMCDICSTRVIHDYSYRPDPNFISSQGEENPRLYFGIEVEMESNQSNQHRDEAAEYAHRLEPAGIAYLKSDGSLECGFELVTHPITYNAYRNDVPQLWEVMEHLRTGYQMKSWDTRTCGLHIHVSRRGFNGGSHIHRFLKLVYSNQHFYEKLAGRYSSRWAKFDDVVGEDGKRHFKDKINGYNTERYSAVNTQNRNTLEVRIFRGTINTSTILAQIGLIHASVEYTRTMSIKEVSDGALNYNKFIEYIVGNSDIYPELVNRLQRNGFTQLQVSV